MNKKFKEVMEGLEQIKEYALEYRKKLERKAIIIRLMQRDMANLDKKVIETQKREKEVREERIRAAGLDINGF